MMISVYDSRQLGLKVSANSLFGFLGVKNGKLSLEEGARCVTAKGRQLINQVKEYIEEKYNGVQIYGDTDCCRGHTPILVRYETGAINFVQIEDIIKLPVATDQQEYYDLKQYNYDIWTEKGWTKMHYLMRHKTTKKLYRVVTHTGVVDVTEDHSLLDPNAVEVTPGELSIGMELLHKDLPIVEFEDDNFNTEIAWAWGFFMAEGTCGKYDCPSGIKRSWSISNQNKDYLERARRAFCDYENKHNFIVDPCMKSSNVDKLNARGD